MILLGGNDLSTSIFDNLWKLLASVLPLSPFQPIIAQFQGLPALAYLNWFFPVADCLRIMALWLTAVGTFYMYSVIMRWIKVIGG